MKIGKALTWNDLANIFDKETGLHARTFPMDKIFTWAENHPEKFFIDDKEELHETIEE